MAEHKKTRYSESELAEFREVIQKKRKRTEEELAYLKAQIIEMTESTDDSFGTDYIDDSSTGMDIEMINSMAARQSKYLRELENALIRIENKTYGVCSISGELIDKRRLMLVPTTTKSIIGKENEQTQADKRGGPPQN